MAKLKALVDELVSLNDDNLAQRVIMDSDVQWCLSELQDMLAVDMEPVRHGRWERLEPNSLVKGCFCGTCSACGIRSKYIENTAVFPKFVLSRYCPHCGAKMEEGEPDEED